MNHTATPWTWQNDWKEDGIYSGNMGILEPGVLWFGMDGAEGIYCPNEADARLLAAAPKMLEALKKIEKEAHNPFATPEASMNTMRIAAESAIRKATS